MTQNKLTLIVGLGNYGQQYLKTRHNVGLMALQALSNQYKVDFSPKIAVAGHVAEVPQKNLVLFWPETLMNIAGKNVKAAVNKYKIEKSRIVVLHDCLETKLGKVKMGNTGSFKGHNGLKSISQELGGHKDFYRVRIGIGRPVERDPETVAAFVLSNFSRRELEAFDEFQTFNEVYKSIESLKV